MSRFGQAPSSWNIAVRAVATFETSSCAFARSADFVIDEYPPIDAPINTAMMPITTSISTRVKPL